MSGKPRNPDEGVKFWGRRRERTASDLRLEESLPLTAKESFRTAWA